MHWEIHLVGDDADLQMLSEAMQTGDILIFQEEGRYTLQSEELNNLQDANDVYTRAEAIITSLSGASQLCLGSYTPINVDGLTQFLDDGTRSDFAQLMPATIQIRAFPVGFSITDSDGTVEQYRPAEPVKKWLKVAATDEKVAKALRLRNSKNLNWVELYRIYEVIEGDVGRNQIVKSGWATNNEVTRFTRTANSVAVSGDQARHGKETTDPPSNAMFLGQARELINRILIFWITTKV